MNNPLQITKLINYRHIHHENDYVFGGHSHTNWEVNIILNGTFEVAYDDTIYTLEENMLIIYEPDIFHRSHVISAERAEVFIFHFMTEDIPKRKGAGIFALSELDASLARIVMEEAEKNANPKDTQTLLASTFNYEVQKFLELLLIRSMSSKTLPPVKQSAEEKLYRQAATYMKENIEKNLTMDEIAKHCRTNTTKLKRVFKKFTGTGAMTHFAGMKITAAKMLLREDLSVLEISERLGYSSQAYMSLCFKKETGMSPLQYKKSLL